MTGKPYLHFSPTRFLSSALLVVSTIVAQVVGASGAEIAYIRTGQSSLTAFDAKDFNPVGTVQLAGTSLWGLTTSPATGRVYAFDINTQTVLVIDAARNSVVGSISLQDLHFTPRGMAASADGKRLYFAAENKTLGLIAIDLERNLRMGEFAVPYAWRVVPHPTLDRLWVTTKYGELYTVRASDMAVLGHRQLAGAEIALSDDGSKLYLTGERSSLLVIDTATDDILYEISTGFCATTLRVAGRWAYLGNKEKGVLEVVDLLARQVEAEITLDVGKYLGVHQIDVTGNGSRVVVLLDNDLRYKFAVVDGERHALESLHDGMGSALICASKFIMEVHVPERSFTVNSTVDATDALPGDGVCETGAGNGNCTLRAAVQEANAASGAVTVALPAGEYLLSIPGLDEDQGAAGDLDVIGNLTIRGAGSETTVVDGGALDRVMEVGAGGSLRLEGVTVRNGYLPFRDPGSFSNRAGAGILNGGVLNLAGVAVLDNHCDGFGGAGVHSDGVLRVEDCTFSANVSKGVVLFRDPFGTLVSREAEGVAAIYARQAEVTGCLVTGNTGAVAVSMDGPLRSSVVSNNDARGVNAGSISNSTIRGNRGPGCSASLIVDSTVSDNVNAVPDGCGGGVFWGDTYRQLVVTRSTISGNSAAYGGGICAQHFEVGNSTISGNTATGDGGGIYLKEYDEWNYIRNCTISANTADSDSDGFGDGGGIYNPRLGSSFDTYLANTILAGNVDFGGEAPDCSGYLGSSQFNLVGTVGGCNFAAQAWDIVGTAEAPVNPELGPLQDNGGPTLTHALLAVSPAIDAGHPYVFLPTDQRGVGRPLDGNDDGIEYSDIGAFELVPGPANAAPVAAGDSYTMAGGGTLSPVVPGVLGNDSDADGNTMTAVKVSDPAHGTLTLNADGSFSYTPTTNYSGPDYFTYKANDGKIDSNLATVTITVMPITLSAALDVERTWMTGGPSPWVGQPSEHHDGVDAAQSGPLANKQSNWLKTSVRGPKKITFWWKTSSKTGGVLRFYVDARRMATRSGNTGWQQRSIQIGRGTHELKWMFIRDASGSAGMNAGFLDQVRITAPAR